MTEDRCYREPTNGAYFVRNGHRHDCDDSLCRGCTACPERHCGHRRSCAWHVAEVTCGRCLSGVRRDLRWIGALSALMPTAAMADGIDSEAANLAGPATDPEAWTWRKVAARQGKAWHVSLVEKDDEHHPARVLGTWARMIAEDYSHDMPFAATLTWCVDYLDRNLHRIAQDEEQDFPLMGRELRKCRQHLEAVLHNDDRPDRGIPCPECTSEEAGVGPRLVRQYGHWCDDEDCRKEHHDNDGADVWVCPKDDRHAWSHEDYDRRLVERKATA